MRIKATKAPSGGEFGQFFHGVFWQVSKTTQGLLFLLFLLVVLASFKIFHLVMVQHAKKGNKKAGIGDFLGGFTVLHEYL